MHLYQLHQKSEKGQRHAYKSQPASTDSLERQISMRINRGDLFDKSHTQKSVFFNLLLTFYSYIL